MGDFLLDSSDHWTKRQEAAPYSVSLELNAQVALENVTPKEGGGQWRKLPAWPQSEEKERWNTTAREKE